MNRYLTIIILIAFAGIGARAQTRFRTDEPIISQLKNGTAPGLLFDKTALARKDTATTTANKGSLGRQIRENAVPGMTYQKATTGTQPAAEWRPKPDTTLKVKAIYQNE